MKKHVLIGLVLIAAHFKALPNNPLQVKLAEINQCWLEQPAKETAPYLIAISIPQNDQGMIRTHLQVVEQILRNRDVSHLNPELRAARIYNLNHLREYWMTGRFPINTNKTLTRNPIFIDDYNTFCAVGYLIKTSGNEQLSRQISKKQNLSYLRDIKIEGLNEWANSSGLTLDELAWIQPAYIADNNARSVGAGVNGTVYAMTGNDAQQILYVGGAFTLANGAVSCNNIMAVEYTLSDIKTYTFTALGSGLNGTVKTLFKDGNTLYAGGLFDHSGSTEMNHIARWNGTSWAAMGSLNGPVYAITKYNNDIYAAGEFSLTLGPSFFYNIAKWDGNAWQPLPGTMVMNGPIYALSVFDNKLIAGGAFTMVDNLNANHVFAYNGSEPSILYDGVPATVRAFSTPEATPPVLLAGGDLVSAGSTDTFGIAEFRDSGWEFSYKNAVRNTPFFYPPRVKEVNTFSGFLVGGMLTTESMYYSWGSGIYNSGRLNALVTVDSSVYCIYKAGPKTFFGGIFTKLFANNNMWTAGSLVVLDDNFSGIGEAQDESNVHLAPNPLVSTTTIRSDNTIRSYSVYDIQGKLIIENKVNDKQFQLDRSVFAQSGLYTIQLIDASGNRIVQKLAVQ